MTLRPFIARAYEVRVFQVTGGPDWIDFDRFDIVGRGAEGTANAMRPAMLRGCWRIGSGSSHTQKLETSRSMHWSSRAMTDALVRS